jgi:hypothetical protein
MNVQRTVNGFIKAGFSGILLEDQACPLLPISHSRMPRLPSRHRCREDRDLKMKCAMCARARMRACVRACACASSRVRTLACLRACVSACLSVHACLCARACARACLCRSSCRCLLRMSVRTRAFKRAQVVSTQCAVRNGQSGAGTPTT